jgi:hypothetical protein
MDREEALKQIQEISLAMESGNRFLMSSALLYAYGVLFLLVPVIETVTGYMTFGLYDRAANPWLFGGIHAAVYFGLVWLARTVACRLSGEDHVVTVHPLLRKTMAVHRPVIAAAVGTILVLIPLGYENLIPAMMFIYFGILLNFYGRFAGRTMLFISWSFMAAGFLEASLAHRIQPTLWMYFNTYFGLALLYLGHWQRHKKRRME